MKVSFDATFEDFVDVNKRSVKTDLSNYVMLAAVVVVMSGTAGGLLYQSHPS